MDLNSLKEVLLTQALRPDSVSTSDKQKYYLVPGFTSSKHEKHLDPGPMRGRSSSIFTELPLSDLLKHFESMIESGHGDITFNYEGRFSITVRGVHVSLSCGEVTLSLKQTSEYLGRLAELMQFAHSLAHAVYQLSAPPPSFPPVALPAQS